MELVSAEQAQRVAERTAATVASLHSQADEAQARGDATGAQALRDLAASRERAGARVAEGAHIARG